VAAPLLFDISRMDLSQIAASTERVEEINPHRGHMRLLDRVIWMNEDATIGLGVKQVRDDEFWVQGHVPGRPLLPGILMIEAAAQLCCFLQGVRPHSEPSQFMGFIRCDDVVFRGQVVPGDTLYLLAEEISYRRRRFTSKTQATVNERLVYEGTITGMAI
jgi:3-hydroxyacyl-[acyl-carrier-protein] dehydratase